jgi:pimeloyl-ACP methyl ester carboxylesterase
MEPMTRLTRPLLALAATLALIAAALPAAAAGRAITCRELTFPADGWELAATVCRPKAQPRATVVLVHGSASNRSYWDPPGAPARHAAPRLLAKRGYLVVNLDRLGFGNSSRPAEVTAEASASALHRVIHQLRRDRRWDTTTDKLATIGHSSGSALIIREAAAYDDVDLLVPTGMFHSFSEVEPAIFPAMLWPAADDPRFAGDPTIPDGYTTTEPSTRVLWHFAHTGNSSLAMLELDERRLADAQPPGDSGGFEAEVFGSPVSPTIDRPVLSVYGDRDVSRCASPACPQAAAEAAFWGASPDFGLLRVRDTAHAINLHRNAAQTTGRIADWLDTHI